MQKMLKRMTSEITFSEQDKQVPFFHNRPLYVMATVNSHEFTRALLDGGASVNVMPLSSFYACGIPKGRLVKSPIDVHGFGNDKTQTLGYVHTSIELGKIRSTIKFHVIDAHPSYQLLIGRIWMHQHGLVPSTYHQCAKAILNGNEVTIKATERPF